MNLRIILVLVPAALVSANKSPVAAQNTQEQKSNGVKRQISGAPLGFAYSVDDPVTGNNYGRQESSNGSAVSGQYFVRLPNGDLQIVNYTASAEKGYVANVYTQVNPAGATSQKSGEQATVSNVKPASTVAALPNATSGVALEGVFATQVKQDNENVNVAVSGAQVASAVYGSGETENLQLIPLGVEGGTAEYASSYTGEPENVLVPVNYEYQPFYGHQDCDEKVPVNDVVLVYQNGYYSDAEQPKEDIVFPPIDEREVIITPPAVVVDSATVADTPTTTTTTQTQTTTAAPATTKTTTVPATTTTATTSTTTTAAPTTTTAATVPMTTTKTTVSTTAATTTSSTVRTTTSAPKTTTTKVAPTTIVTSSSVAYVNQNDENDSVAVSGAQVASAVYGSGETANLQLIPLGVEGGTADYASSYTGGLENVLVPYNTEYQSYYSYPQENSVFLLTNQPDCDDKVPVDHKVIVYQKEYYPDAIQQLKENTAQTAMAVAAGLGTEPDTPTPTTTTTTLTKTSTAPLTTTKTAAPTTSTAAPTTSTAASVTTTTTTTIAPKSETTRAAPTTTEASTVPVTTTAAPKTTTAAPTSTTTTTVPTTTTAKTTTKTTGSTTTVTTTFPTIRTTTSAPETTTTKAAPTTTETTRVPTTTAPPTETSFIQVVAESQAQLGAQDVSLENQQYIPSSQYVFLIPAQNDYLQVPYVYQPQPIFLNPNVGSEYQTNVQQNTLPGVLPSGPSVSASSGPSVSAPSGPSVSAPSGPSISASSGPSAPSPNQSIVFVHDSTTTEATIPAVPAISKAPVPIVPLPSVAVNLTQSTATSVSPVLVTAKPASSTSTESTVTTTTKPSILNIPVFETGFEPMEGPFQSVILDAASTSTAAPIAASSQPQSQQSKIGQSSTAVGLDSLELVTPPSVPLLDGTPSPPVETADINQNEKTPLVPLPQEVVQGISVIQPGQANAKSYGSSSTALPVPVYGVVAAVQPSQTYGMPPAPSYGSPSEPSVPAYGPAPLLAPPTYGNTPLPAPPAYGNGPQPSPSAYGPAPLPVPSAYGVPKPALRPQNNRVPVMQPPVASYPVPAPAYGAAPVTYGAAPVIYGIPSYPSKPGVQKPIPIPVPMQMKPYGLVLPQFHQTKGKGPGAPPSWKSPAIPMNGGKQVVVYKPVISKKEKQLKLKPVLGSHPTGKSMKGVKYHTIGKLKFDTPPLAGRMVIRPISSDTLL